MTKKENSNKSEIKLETLTAKGDGLGTIKNARAISNVALAVFMISASLAFFEFAYFHSEIQPPEDVFGGIGFFVGGSAIIAFIGFLFGLVPAKTSKKLELTPLTINLLLSAALCTTILEYFLGLWGKSRILVIIILPSMVILLSFSYVAGFKAGKKVTKLVNAKVPNFYKYILSDRKFRRYSFFVFCGICAISIFLLASIVIQKADDFSGVDGRLKRCERLKHVSCTEKVLAANAGKLEEDSCNKLDITKNMCLSRLAFSKSDISLCYKANDWQCVRRILKSLDNPIKICDNAQDLSNKEDCISKVIFYTDSKTTEDIANDIKVCNVIRTDNTESAIVRQSCYYSVSAKAFKLGFHDFALDICRQSQNPNICFNNLAFNSKDSIICNEIIDTRMKSTCKQRVFDVLS